MGEINFRYYNVRRLVISIILMLLLLDLIWQGIGWLIQLAIEELNYNSGKVLLVRTPANGFIIMALMGWYDKHLWQKRLFKWIVKVPNMSGRYIGKLESSHLENGKRVVLPCAFEIIQSASSITTRLYVHNVDTFKTTNSESMLEEISQTSDPNIFALDFIHTNTGQRDMYGLSKHEGVTSLRYNVKSKAFEGKYFNEPKRKTYGDLKFTFESNELQYKY